MSNKNAQWYKEIGGDFGCMRTLGRRSSTQGRWIWYDCLQCARFAYPEVFSTPRWQGPPSKAILSAKKDRLNGRRIVCEGSKWHQKIWEEYFHRYHPGGEFKAEDIPW